MDGEKTAGCAPGAIRCPDIPELKHLSDKLKLKCSTQELDAIHDMIPEICSSYQRINDMAEKRLPVKYPRVTGHKAPNGEGWYWKCEIQGAKSGPLSGKTFAIKDNVCVAGIPLMMGSKILEGFTPDVDATIVTRILDAGGSILGKSVCEDLCICVNSCTSSNGPLANPYDPSRSTGGSSSGSAYLVANGSVDMAIGGDQGGSIRIPASCCGIVGLKPTFGLVPYTGIIPGERTLDHVGPMTKTVEDCATLLQVIAGYDNGTDPRQPPDLVVPEYSALLKRSMAGIKVGILKEGFDCVESDIRQFVLKMAKSLSTTGATVDEISIPEHLDGSAISIPIKFEGNYELIAKGNGAGYGWKGYYPSSVIQALSGGLALRPFDLPWSAKFRSMWAEYIKRTYGNKFYSKAQNLSQVLKQTYDKALQNVDVLVMPTMLGKPPLLPTANHSLQDVHNLTISKNINMAPFNLSGHPALSLNVGFLDGFPCGMMIVGRMFDDLKVLQIAYAYEQLRDSKYVVK